MVRIQTPFVSGTVLNNPLAIGDTTLSSAGLAALGTVAAPNIAAIVLDPLSVAGAPEVVWVTAHTALATTATISRAAEGSTARQHAVGIAWVHGPTTVDLTPAAASMALIANFATPTSTTSTSAVDLVTISGLSIPVTSGIKIIFNFRKTGAAAKEVGFGLKVNATVVMEAIGVTGIGSSATQQAEDGYAEIVIAPRSANYLNGVNSEWASYVSATGAAALSNFGAGLAAPMPNATITSIAIRAINATSSNAAAVSSVQVWQLG